MRILRAEHVFFGSLNVGCNHEASVFYSRVYPSFHKVVVLCTCH
jgi:hypothetical protein